MRAGRASRTSNGEISVRALNRKLLRELWRLRGQMLSIALVVASGIMTVITMRGTYETLVDAQASYYREMHFADVWAPLERAPEALLRKLEDIPGVAAVDTRVTLMATLDLPGVDAPAQGRFLSIPEVGRPILNDLHLLRGRSVEPGAPDEVVISKKFAEARHYEPGDSLRAIINGRARDLDIVGIAISPEHTFATPPGTLFPDDERYGILWMGRDALGPAYDMDGAFNEALLSLTPGTDPQAVITRVDEILDPYGGLGAYPRADQQSHLILKGELDQNRVMGTAIPAVFLAVAAFLLHLVLGRLIATQRSEIAVLKAFGYRDREVGAHYLTFALAAVVVGALLGTGLGRWLGDLYVSMYGLYFDFPDLRYQLSGSLLFAATAVSVIAAGAGALGAVRTAVSLPPAEAMRPEPPKRFEPGLLERLGVGRLLPPAGRMILRNMERTPVRSLLASTGVAFSVAILLIGMFMFDGVDVMMDLQFRKIQREDMLVSFVKERPESVRHELRAMPGVERVETFRTVAARLRSAHREREVGLQGLEPDGRLRRIVNADGHVHPVPAEGVVLSRYLAERLHVETGDSLGVELLEGRRARGRVRVAGVVDDFLGMGATMSLDDLHALSREPNRVNGAFLLVDESLRGDLARRLKNVPAVAGVTSPASMLAAFEQQLGDSLYIAVGFLLGFASVIAVAVIYNGARISLSERGHELASLRVMGFRRGEVATLLLGEQAIVTAVAIPLGWAIGYALSFAVVEAMQTEAYRIPLVISARTYFLSALATVAAALGSAWLVRRRIHRLDLIAVLKTRE